MFIVTRERKGRKLIWESFEQSIWLQIYTYRPWVLYKMVEWGKLHTKPELFFLYICHCLGVSAVILKPSWINYSTRGTSVFINRRPASHHERSNIQVTKQRRVRKSPLETDWVWRHWWTRDFKSMCVSFHEYAHMHTHVCTHVHSSPTARRWTGIYCQISSNIRLQIKCSVKVMGLSHPLAIPPLLVHGRIVLHEIGPWCQNGWGLLPVCVYVWVCVCICVHTCIYFINFVCWKALGAKVPQ